MPKSSETSSSSSSTSQTEASDDAASDITSSYSRSIYQDALAELAHENWQFLPEYENASRPLSIEADQVLADIFGSQNESSLDYLSLAIHSSLPAAHSAIAIYSAVLNLPATWTLQGGPPGNAAAFEFDDRVIDIPSVGGSPDFLMPLNLFASGRDDWTRIGVGLVNPAAPLRDPHQEDDDATAAVESSGTSTVSTAHGAIEVAPYVDVAVGMVGQSLTSGTETLTRYPVGAASVETVPNHSSPSGREAFAEGEVTPGAAPLADGLEVSVVVAPVAPTMPAQEDPAPLEAEGTKVPYTSEQTPVAIGPEDADPAPDHAVQEEDAPLPHDRDENIDADEGLDEEALVYSSHDSGDMSYGTPGSGPDPALAKALSTLLSLDHSLDADRLAATHALQEGDSSDGSPHATRPHSEDHATNGFPQGGDASADMTSQVAHPVSEHHDVRDDLNLFNTDSW